MNSDHIKKGYQRAPHRAMLKASGYTDWEMERPFVAVVNAYNSIIPGHVHLKRITEAVKAGENTLEVTVINTWPHRIFGDAQPDAGKPVTYTSYHFYNADSALYPAGLLGPVQVTTIQ